MKATRASQTFGPFWGEFGWEIAQWAPYVNARAEEFDRVRCMPGHAELYAVDCPIEQSHPRPSGHEPDMLQPWPVAASCQMPSVTPVKGVPCIVGDLKPVPLYPGCAAPRRYIVLHCRGIGKCHERNMTQAKWDELVRLLNAECVEPVIVGSNEDYLPVGKVTDLRGASLDDTISFMRTARVVVGASSGPMHLAQACEAPIIVWSGNAKKDKPRYKDVWNHFGSPTRFVASTWQPGVGKILGAIEDAL